MATELRPGHFLAHDFTRLNWLLPTAGCISASYFARKLNLFLDPDICGGPPVRNVLKLEDSMEMSSDIRELLYGEEGNRYLYEVSNLPRPEWGI